MKSESLAVLAVHAKEGKKWALLVASANGWYNYGMQADVYHAYQVFKEGGVPEEHIIVMAYDDIAEDRSNPFKGQVFQSYDLRDTYKGLKIDYKADSVNKKTFKAVLQGDKQAVKNLTGGDGKVIDSGPDDNVFVFVSNHGSPGHICWLDGDDMSATELNGVIKNLHKNKRYKNLVFYIDTCFSGSMFEHILPKNIGVYAATAANATNVAWSADCASAAFGEQATCLGGLFSINWVYELLSDDRTGSTMNMQFEEAKLACKGQSTPHQYGDLSIAELTQDQFFGDSAQNKKPRQSKRHRRSTETQSVVAKHMLAYQTLKNQLSRMPENSLEAERVRAKLSQVETLMGHADQFIKDVATTVYGRFGSDESFAWAETNFGPINWSCYEPVVKSVKDHCPGMMRDEDVRYFAGAKFGLLVNVCNEFSTSTVLAAVKAAAKVNALCNI
ncbi:hypothetical protein RRG08_016333 [Elysia crispata]|uniref:Legumain n=1 Tax=Elysia crispata TaxID=231223 RepID=A0AAE1E1D3_9GAST|nr:hypothetical protein RRG08_016333 [Elysia crispata]